ncbi:sulfonate transport system substrate-binding protein [Nocardia transvalensis]|uniref:Sulfonate transport system substrate-binding protein n=1 Tax=Nocardia transvalensis TaxID=37333 RepID=A0A7W9PJ18_9NOCA|nr:ABC transporter substrate-binding protein [Nocardia transvalensis]MBB5916529.1 sulfonate transport system substrate-binding protein [Nocardia transvalensis]
MIPRSSRLSLRRRTAALLLAVVAVAGPGLTGCANHDETSGAADGPLPVDVPPGTELVVADQQERVQTWLRASGELDKLPFTIKFANFVGGPAILEAFRAGAADVAQVGDVPPIHALAAGQDVPIVAAYQSNPLALKLAVAPGRSITRLADLKGRKIAYAEGTAQQAGVLRALAKAGLAPSDVTLVRLQLNDFLDAVRTGQVDVAPLIEPNVTRLLRTPGASVIPDSELAGLYGGLGYLYARREAVRDPAKAAATRALVAAFIRAQQWSNLHQDEWARTYYVGSQKVGADDAKRIVDSYGVYTFPHLDQRLVNRQQATIDAIDAAGELPKKIRAADGFDLRFDAVVTQTVTEIGASFGTEPK